MERVDFLVVDDDPGFGAALKRSLERKGHSVVVAESIEGAQALCERYHPQKAVIDLKLEKQSGLALIPELRQRFPDIRMLMLTGYSSIATAVDAIKLGADNYLQKPAGTRAIIEALDTAPKSQPGTNTDTDITAPSLERLTWEHIQQALKDNDGNISATARQLGMHRRTLQRKLQKRPVKT